MEGNCVESTLNFVFGGTDLVACCEQIMEMSEQPLSFLSSSPKYVSHRRLSCLILCLSSTVPL